MNAQTPIATTDLSDQHGPDVTLAQPIFRDFGGRAWFFGEIQTVEAPEDNSKVREQLEQPGRGRVLIVEGKATTRCALLGDQLGELAVKNGWAGVIVNGYVRDSARLRELDLGVKALAAFPRKSEKKGRGAVGTVVSFAGVTFVPGQFVYVDQDGILISSRKLHD